MNNLNRLILKVWQQEKFIYLVLLLVVFFVRFPTLQQPFENDSGAIAYHARLITRGFTLYKDHHPAHHMPGTYYLYAASFFLLGDKVQSVRIILLLWTGISVVLVYCLGKMVAGKKAGFIAGLNSAVMLSHGFIAGTNTKIESFVILPQVTAVFVLLTLVKKKSPSWKYFFVGFLSFAVIFFKANYVSVICLTGLLIFRELANDWKNQNLWKQTIARSGWAIVGFALPAVLLITYYAANESLERFLNVFTLGFSYTQITQDQLASPLYIVIYPLAILGKSNFILLLSALAGMLLYFLNLRRKPTTTQNAKNHSDPDFLPFIIFWFCFTFIETGISRTFLHNYYLIFIPPLTIISAWFIVKLAHDIHASLPNLPNYFPKIALLLMALFAFVFGVAPSYPYLKSFYTEYLTGNVDYNTVLQEGLPEGVAETMQVMKEIGQYINTNTQPSDTIYYWSNFMELYYYADRLSSADIIWPLYVDAFGNKEQIFQAEYILMGDTPLGYQETPDWFKEGLNNKYELEITLYGQQLYRHIR
ncbi:MAG: glycosyltransferase family 39 protein [Chloroflexota bacterium]